MARSTRSRTRRSPFPQGTITRTGPKFTVTFMTRLLKRGETPVFYSLLAWRIQRKRANTGTPEHSTSTSTHKTVRETQTIRQIDVKSDSRITPGIRSQIFLQSPFITSSVSNERRPATNAGDGRHFTRTTKQRRLFAASSSTVPSSWLQLRACSSLGIIFFAHSSQVSPGHSHEGISRSCSSLEVPSAARWLLREHARTHAQHAHLASYPGKPNCPTGTLATLGVEDYDAGSPS